MLPYIISSTLAPLCVIIGDAGLINGKKKEEKRKTMHKSWAKVTVITFQRVTSTSPLFSLFLACTYIHTTMHVEIHLSHLYIVSTVYEGTYGEKNKQTTLSGLSCWLRQAGLPLLFPT